jgi:hypothetical protein
MEVGSTDRQPPSQVGCIMDTSSPTTTGSHLPDQKALDDTTLPPTLPGIVPRLAWAWKWCLDGRRIHRFIRIRSQHHLRDCACKLSFRDVMLGVSVPSKVPCLRASFERSFRAVYDTRLS